MTARSFTKRFSSARYLAALVSGLLVLTARVFAENGTPLSTPYRHIMSIIGDASL
jgi:hypothetical protein